MFLIDHYSLFTSTLKILVRFICKKLEDVTTNVRKSFVNTLYPMRSTTASQWIEQQTSRNSLVTLNSSNLSIITQTACSSIDLVKKDQRVLLLRFLVFLWKRTFSWNLSSKSDTIVINHHVSAGCEMQNAWTFHQNLRNDEQATTKRERKQSRSIIRQKLVLTMWIISLEWKHWI